MPDRTPKDDAASAPLTALAASGLIAIILALGAAPAVAAADDLSLTFSGAGTTGEVTATFTAPQPGRRVALEVKEPGGDWVRVGKAKEQSRGGWVKFQLTELRHEAFSYRVAVRKWNGSPAYVSAETDWAPGPFEPKRFGSPVMRITTENGVPITSKEDYVNGIARLKGVDYPLKIRGRGNSTWLLPKKPYRVKLDSEAALLGMPSNRDWALIANYADHSLARNAIALGLSPHTSIPWSPRSAFVEVTLNGEYEGSYQFTEHIEASTDRVNLSDQGLLLEVDERGLTDGDPGFRTPHGFPIVYQDPDDPSAETMATFEAFLADFETALYGPDFADPEDGYAAFINVDTFVDWLLVNELFKNVDADLYSSCWFTWDAGKLSMGPLWDFDVSSGFRIDFWPGYSDPEGWWLRGDELPFDPRSAAHHADHWFARMLEDPGFQGLVVARWNELKPVFAKSAKKPRRILESLGVAAHSDHERWSGGYFYPESAHAAGPQGEAKFLGDWLSDRVAWIDAALNP
jgi:hypothetical protein